MDEVYELDIESLVELLNTQNVIYTEIINYLLPMCSDEDLPYVLQRLSDLEEVLEGLANGGVKVH